MPDGSKSERLLVWRADELVDENGRVVATLEALADGGWQPAVHGRPLREAGSRELAVHQVEHVITGDEWSLARIRLTALGGEEQDGYLLMRRRITAY